MSEAEGFKARVHYERGEALARQGAYEAAIRELEEALTCFPPPELEMAVCYDIAISIQKRYHLADSVTFQVDGEQAQQAGRIIELCDRVMYIYRSQFETGKILTNLPIRRVYDQAEDLKSRTRSLRLRKKSQGCFLATAVYGSAAFEVRILRQYRDERLLRYGLGRKLVKAYYRISPPIADIVGRHRFLRWVTKVFIVRPSFLIAARSCRDDKRRDGQA